VETVAVLATFGPPQAASTNDKPTKRPIQRFVAISREAYSAGAAPHYISG